GGGVEGGEWGGGAGGGDREGRGERDLDLEPDAAAVGPVEEVAALLAADDPDVAAVLLEAQRQQVLELAVPRGHDDVDVLARPSGHGDGAPLRVHLEAAPGVDLEGLFDPRLGDESRRGETEAERDN